MLEERNLSTPQDPDPVRLELFRRRLFRDGVAERLHIYYEKRLLQWLRSPLRPVPGLDPARGFAQQLAREGVPDWQCRQAYQAVRVWIGLEPRAQVPTPAPAPEDPQEPEPMVPTPEPVLDTPEIPPLDWAQVLENMDMRMRTQGYSPRTRESYLDWGRRLSQASPEVPRDTATASQQVQRFLRQMAIGRNLSQASLSQARNALAWLVRRELGLGLELEAKGDAHRGKRLPKVIAPDQVRLLLKACRAPWDLFFSLQYGCGLRLAEILDLRVQEIDLEREVVLVRHGKGDKDRLVPLPKSLRAAMREHLEARRRLWLQDHEQGLDAVELPHALAKKLAGAENSWEWQHVFGNARPLRHASDGSLRRYRPLENTVRDALHEAAREAGIVGRVHPHLLRHCYATHLLEAGTQLRNIQELMGHARLETTMIYMHVRSGAAVATSPLDRI